MDCTIIWVDDGWMEFATVKGKRICTNASRDLRWAVWKGEAHLEEYLARTGRKVMTRVA